jgi:hypothetical protein
MEMTAGPQKEILGGYYDPRRLGAMRQAIKVSCLSNPVLASRAANK